MSKQKVIWECSHCGNTQPKWTGSCNQCNSWNSFVEQLLIEEKQKRFSSPRKELVKPVRLQDIKNVKPLRTTTEMGDFDGLLGGGVVLGSLIAQAFAKKQAKVLYICGEESVEQTSIRASRLNVKSENLFFLHETLFEAIQKIIEEMQPQVIIVDSIQILYKESIPSSPGSVVQVREITNEFLHICKGQGITTFLIGHVTKSGDLAGPRVLEHLVDTVLEFEGDQKQGLRILRCCKNRFGPTEDVALFQMKESGLQEIKNPSSIFLEERRVGIAGSTIVSTLEGSRAILVEIQALVTPSSFSNPSRRSTGLDQNRLALLLAVLEKRVGYQLQHYDVFVSAAGGMRILEPAADLGILLAIASSFKNRAISQDHFILGEVGLSGEVRSVNRIESRLKEAINMGFKRCILPKKNMKNLESFQDKIFLMGVDVVDEAIDKMF
jgi:DNA repair protein RadA/Sms